jgi:hypothetical protein
LLRSRYLAALLLSRTVVRTLTGDLLLTFRANFNAKWLRRVPVLRGLVRFLGLPIGNYPFLYLNLAYMIANFTPFLKGKT